MRKKPDPINQAINQPSNLSQEIPGRTKIETSKTNMHTTNNMNDRLVNNNPFMPDVPFHLDLLLRPPTQPIKQNMACKQNPQNVQDINPNINFDFEETHHFKKASCQKHFKDQTNHSFKIPNNWETS